MDKNKILAKADEYSAFRKNDFFRNQVGILFAEYIFSGRKEMERLLPIPGNK